MKDILLTAKRQRTELLLYLACLLIATLLNVYSIIAFETEWKELYTQILWVLCLSVLFYAILLIIRLLYWGIRLLIKNE